MDVVTYENSLGGSNVIATFSNDAVARAFIAKEYAAGTGSAYGKDCGWVKTDEGPWMGGAVITAEVVENYDADAVDQQNAMLELMYGAD